jgi:hypothetical protein
VAADLVALVIPSCGARLWHARQWAISLAGWAVWAMTFVFAVTAGIGFASVNIADVTLSRASRITPAVHTAQEALADAMAARDRECKGGVGRYCREREAAVNERRQTLDAAMQSVGQSADPQTDAAIRLVAWATHGVLQASGNDFAMLRLVLLALLPQIGGILLMVGRSTNETGEVMAACRRIEELGWLASEDRAGSRQPVPRADPAPRGGGLAKSRAGASAATGVARPRARLSELVGRAGTGTDTAPEGY